jgi:hypothetical protein
VIGGALAFGFIGVFLGPTLLAVGFSVVREWATVAPPPPAATTAAELVERPPAVAGDAPPSSAA